MYVSPIADIENRKKFTGILLFTQIVCKFLFFSLLNKSNSYIHMVTVQLRDIKNTEIVFIFHSALRQSPPKTADPIRFDSVVRD